MWITRLSFPSSSSTLLLQILVLLWTQTPVPPARACQEEDMPNQVILDWFRQRVLDGLGLDKAPPLVPRDPEVGRQRTEAGHSQRRSFRVGRAAWAHHNQRQHQENTQVILFPSTDSTCNLADPPSEDPSSRHFTYYFQPSINNQEAMVTSALFWFYAGEAAASTYNSSSAPLFILTSDQKLLQAAEGPFKAAADGWVTYRFDLHLHGALAEGSFVLQVRCLACDCREAGEADKTPFIHLHTQPRGPDRSPRRARVTIPWSPSTLDHLQRPSQGDQEYSDCRRMEINITFEELGWDNWIVYPKVLNFFYCKGNCTALERTTTRLGIKQCCAPVPGTMKSLRFTTTSDGGLSFKYETLTNIIPEECSCI
ncbi:inhibin alpha chain [Osmerus eperlanus]|uniref:inhibin alpha chain n=1 Tax=Osmerus eperlanus TaxID=29151 RepID=UPI002E156456